MSSWLMSHIAPMSHVVHRRRPTCRRTTATTASRAARPTVTSRRTAATRCRGAQTTARPTRRYEPPSVRPSLCRAVGQDRACRPPLFQTLCRSVTVLPLAFLPFVPPLPSYLRSIPLSVSSVFASGSSCSIALSGGLWLVPPAHQAGQPATYPSECTRQWIDVCRAHA